MPKGSDVLCNVGTLTVKVAALKDDAKIAKVTAHRGRVLEVLHEVLARAEFADAEYFGGSWRLGHISEVAAMVAALREKLPRTEFVVLPESPWFEAWGTALLTRDEPVHKSPNLARQANLRRLPSLKLYSD